MHKKLGTVLILLGVALLLVGLGNVGRNLWIEEQAGDHAESAMGQLLQQMQSPQESRPGEEPDSTTDQPAPSGPALPSQQEQESRRPMPEILIDGVPYIGYLEIPALDLQLPVLSQSNPENLEIGPCRFYGTVYQKNFVIGGHRYRRHFRKLYTLGYGDRIYFTDGDGIRYAYRVEELEVVEPYQADYLCSGDWDLSLYTCTTGGASRVVVRCVFQ